MAPLRVAVGTFPGVPQSARQARVWTTQQLGADHPRLDDVIDVVAELVANAFEHSRSGEPGGRIGLSLADDPHQGRVRVQVMDEGSDSGVPAFDIDADPLGFDESGRGLRIVQALATSCGTSTLGSCRLVWAVIG